MRLTEESGCTGLSWARLFNLEEEIPGAGLRDLTQSRVSLELQSSGQHFRFSPRFHKRKKTGWLLASREAETLWGSGSETAGLCVHPGGCFWILQIRLPEARLSSD